MDRTELIEKIRKGTDIMFTVYGKGFTICDSESDNEKDIAEWGAQAGMVFKDAESLVYNYVIDGKTLGESAENVIFVDYTMNGND